MDETYGIRGLNAETDMRGNPLGTGNRSRISRGSSGEDGAQIARRRITVPSQMGGENQGDHQRHQEWETHQP